LAQRQILPHSVTFHCDATLLFSQDSEELHSVEKQNPPLQDREDPDYKIVENQVYMTSKMQNA
jgi:hypothetical protein